MIDCNFLLEEAERAGISLNPNGLYRYDLYADRLVTVNKFMNLTAITDPQEIVIKHFIDCLYITKYIKFEAWQKLVDIGSGAGFPGFPLLMEKPFLDVTFVDSLRKRIDFLEGMLGYAWLDGTCLHARAEHLGQNAEYRETFDYATARAVAPLNVLCEYALPLVKLGGQFVSLKGSSGLDELKDAENAIKLLGGEVETADEYKLSNGDGRSIIIVRKISQTPTKYPRTSKRIDSKPL